jgi:hypothetical protein
LTDSLLGGSAQNQESLFSDVLDAYQRNSNWWTVFACFDLVGCQPTVDWIAERTGLPRVDVNEALEGLRMLGYLRQDGDRYYPVHGKDFVHFGFEGLSKAQVVDRHALVSQQILNHLEPTRKYAFDHRCFAADDEIIGELYKDIAAAFDKAFTKSRNYRGADKVFKMTFTAVDVLKTK